MKTVKTMGAIVEDSNGKYLLVQEFKNDMWKPPTGKIRDGEKPYITVMRETPEETGYVVEVICMKRKYSFPGDKGDIIERELFLARKIGGKPKLRKGEIKDMRWVNALEFLDITRTYSANSRDPMARYLEDIIKPDNLKSE